MADEHATKDAQDEVSEEILQSSGLPGASKPPPPILTSPFSTMTTAATRRGSQVTVAESDDSPVVVSKRRGRGYLLTPFSEERAVATPSAAKIPTSRRGRPSASKSLFEVEATALTASSSLGKPLAEDTATSSPLGSPSPKRGRPAPNNDRTITSGQTSFPESSLEFVRASKMSWLTQEQQDRLHAIIKQTETAVCINPVRLNLMPRTRTERSIARGSGKRHPPRPRPRLPSKSSTEDSGTEPSLDTDAASSSEHASSHSTPLPHPSEERENLEETAILQKDFPIKPESEMGEFPSDQDEYESNTGRRWFRIIYPAPENRQADEVRVPVSEPYRQSYRRFPKGAYTADRIGNNRITSDGPNTTLAPVPWAPPQYIFPRGLLGEWGPKSAFHIYLANLRQQVSSDYRHMHDRWLTLATDMMKLHRVLIEVNVMLKHIAPEADDVRDRRRNSRKLAEPNWPEFSAALEAANLLQHQQALNSWSDGKSLLLAAAENFEGFATPDQIEATAVPLHDQDPSVLIIPSQRVLFNSYTRESTTLPAELMRAMMARMHKLLIDVEDDIPPRDPVLTPPLGDDIEREFKRRQRASLSEFMNQKSGKSSSSQQVTFGNTLPKVPKRPPTIPPNEENASAPQADPPNEENVDIPPANPPNEENADIPSADPPNEENADIPPVISG
jgi:hypothetical protein